MPPKPNKRRNNNNDNQKKKPKTNHKMPESMIKRGNKREVVFDPEARKSHLRGFSERKRQRRAFGLAMQKVKDRKSKIEQRASEKTDELQRIEEAEKQKEMWMEEIVRMNNVALDSFGVGGKDESDKDEDNDSDNDGNKKQSQQLPEDVIDMKVYDDKKTETTWGGQVTVTTSVVELDDSSDDDSFTANNSRSDPRSAKSVDKRQKYAGNVKRYMDELKGNMPARKNRDGGQNVKRKGKNGAADMKGVGGGANLKIASKLLNKSKDRGSAGGSAKGKKGKRKGR
jgi:hypothetical protein